MEANNAMTDKIVNYTFFYVTYAFSALLAICVLFYIGKIIYKYFTERSKFNIVTIVHDTSINTQSVSSKQTASPVCQAVTQETNESNPDRLHSQLDKLRRLLNRLNAMGTFSRDTIGDLSAQSTNNINNSIAPSSNLSNFWSSIDFDDLEESTIIEDNFRKTPNSNSISLSVSGISLDSTGINVDNTRRKNIATSSRENALNTVSSALNNQANPSDAIAQILAILDAIMSKNRQNTLTKKTSDLKIVRNSNESLNFNVVQPLHESKYSLESSELNQKSIPLAPFTSIPNELSSTCECVTSENIASHEHQSLEIKTEEIPFIDSTLSPNTKLFDQTSKSLHSQSLMLSSVCIKDKKLKINSLKNKITSSIADSENNSLSETEIIELDKNLVSPFVKANKDKSLPKQEVQFLKPPSLELAVLKEPHFFKDDKYKKTLSERCFTRQDAFELDIHDSKRTRSVSNLLDKRVPLFSDQQCFMKQLPFEMQSQATSFECEENTVVTVSEEPADSELHLQIKNEHIINDNEKFESGLMLTNDKKFSSVSSRSLQLPSINVIVDLKPSVSESELKQTSFLDSLSPSISSRNSNSFLSPVLIPSFSPVENIEWKSPAEPVSNTYFLSKVNHQNERSGLKNACIWSTPPSPKKDISTEAISF